MIIQEQTQLMHENSNTTLVNVKLLSLVLGVGAVGFKYNTC